MDNCRSVRPEQDVQVDTTPCRIKARTPGENTFLNVNTLLQLGGRYASPPYPPGITHKKFDGCIRNVVHNGKVREGRVVYGEARRSASCCCSIPQLNTLEGHSVCEFLLNAMV